MTAVDLVKGKRIEQARNLNDANVFNQLIDIPAKKHHCIQLAAKPPNKAIDEYQNGHSNLKRMECESVCAAPQDCCKNDMMLSEIHKEYLLSDIECFEGLDN